MANPIRCTELVVHQLDNEVLLYDPRVDRSHRLNSSATLIWNRCDGHHSIEDIAAELTEIYDVDYSIALRDTNQALQMLTQEKVLV